MHQMIISAVRMGGSLLKLSCGLMALSFSAIGAMSASPTNMPPAPASEEKPAQHMNNCEPHNFKVALDVGHTPEAPGATSARGRREYSFNMQLAGRTSAALIKSGFTQTKLITARGIGTSQLMSRVEQANTIQPDLVLSIHHDDVQLVYHKQWKVDGKIHDFSDRFTGYSIFVSGDNRHFDESLVFAKLLGKELIKHGMEYSNHHAEAIPGEGKLLIDSVLGIYRYDHLVVLRFSNAPAVLLEAGVIVNRIEELVLSSPQGQDQVTSAVAAAVMAYCETRHVSRK
jgi:N-acetylmuramoyl-L-alanine amidase